MAHPEAILDALKEDASWRLTWSDGFIDEARFRLDPETRADRAALVERLDPSPDIDPADPEQWESALVDAVLSHPAAARLRVLELHLTDFHHSARHAARSLAAAPRAHLAEMYFGHDFGYLYEYASTSTGRKFDPMDHYDEGFAGDGTDALWRALPSLRSLTVEGALLFHWIGGEALTDLRLRGAVLSDGGVFPGSTPALVTLPALTSLTLEITSDVHGVACPAEQLEELTPAGYPSLRALDLSGSEFDAEPEELLAALTASGLHAQLHDLELPDY